MHGNHSNLQNKIYLELSSFGPDRLELIIFDQMSRVGSRDRHADGDLKTSFIENI